MNTLRVKPISVMAGFLRRPYQPELGQNVQKFLPWLVYQVATEPLYHMQFSNRILIPNILDSNHINTPKLEHVCVMYGRRVQSLFSIDKDENTHETSTTTLSHSQAYFTGKMYIKVATSQRDQSSNSFRFPHNLKQVTKLMSFKRCRS